MSSYGFFFQAEDGIRVRTVTGVQTCALPISRSVQSSRALVGVPHLEIHRRRAAHARFGQRGIQQPPADTDAVKRQIGRASCRERVELMGVAGFCSKKKRGIAIKPDTITV